MVGRLESTRTTSTNTQDRMHAESEAEALRIELFDNEIESLKMDDMEDYNHKMIHLFLCECFATENTHYRMMVDPVINEFPCLCKKKIFSRNNSLFCNVGHLYQHLSRRY